ncbi:ubiquitin-conjugating enzyme [Pyrrhoderma noxium]|uniref:Ubiquitin-conjugating enzyme n=1 Tax=Pyrrhoderma noxium TaxID=2282107 RepID=A0A286UXK6_9AGAM|nr:ubiquitin-conjugating enzyme [Pyrrhoderma noxium]
MATSKAIKRITKEWKDLSDEPIEGIVASPVSETDLTVWAGYIDAGTNTPYKGGRFKFELEFPEGFPSKPPKFHFTTRIYHPGVNEQGQVCLPFLRDEWKPAMQLSYVLREIQEKLNNPQPDDPFEPDIAMTLKENPTQFLAKAQEWTQKYAKLE